MKSVKIKDGIYHTGVQDPDLRVFDIIMYTKYGTTYNAFVVKGNKKTALIDTVKAKFFPEYLEKVREITEITEIDYLVVNHTEPDHAGSIEKIIELNPDITIITNYTAVCFLRGLINGPFNYRTASQGKEINLGGKTLYFISAPLLHWPETMYTYVKEDRVLFSCDTFSSHYASREIFDDEIHEDFTDAFQYYYDVILKPFKKYLRSAIKRIENLEIDVVCPGHGPLLRKNINRFRNLYIEWTEKSKEKDTRPKIIVAYASAYGYTKSIADEIIKGLRSVGDFNLVIIDLVEEPPLKALRELENARGLLLGSPTINRDVVPPVWELLMKLSPVNHERIISGAFGAFGWSGEAVPNIESRFRMLRMKILPGIRINFKPCGNELAEALVYGKNFGAAILGDESKLEKFLEWQMKTNPVRNDLLTIEDYPNHYENKDICILWNPDMCTHDTNCYTELTTVFKPVERPWVDTEGASPEEIINTIDRCPSGALRYYLTDGSGVDPQKATGPGSIDR